MTLSISPRYVALATNRHPIPTPEARVLVSRYHSICRDCGCRIAPGQNIVYTPAVSQWINGRLTDITPAIVTHVDRECGREYIVRAVYQSTAATYHVRAYTPDHAIEEADKLIGRSKAKGGVVMAYGVLLDGVCVHTLIVEPTAADVRMQRRMGF